MYKNYVKRFIDVVVSGIAVIILAVPMLLIAAAIKIDDPGPVLFKQRRVGQKKDGQLTYFMIWKFRSMKMSTPKDVPTHLLENPEQYITRVGKFIRRASIDEFPQFCQVFLGQLSLVGPRPALWSQDDLIAEREKYSANDVRPGITGWAQINGRDELAIDVKARLDGEYTTALNSGNLKGFLMDLRCFFGTFLKVLRQDGFVEGGTGELKKQKEKMREETTAK